MKPHIRTLFPTVSLLVASLLAGCALSPGSSSNTSSTTAHPAATISGLVHGGQQPVSGSTIQLWQVGTTGYATGAATLGASTTTDSNGNFTITNAYTCPNASTLVYITATGGNPGAGGNNPSLLLMTPLGACGSLSSTTFITINEVTTVAAAYALAQFMSTSGNIGSYGYANTGLTNAFGTVNKLVSTQYGTALGTTGNIVAPQTEINTLADILAPCVNSTGSTASGQPCYFLFNAAKPSGGATPGNTLAAALDIALNPGNNVGTLFNLSTTNAPFQNTLPTAPNDWTVALSYVAGGYSANGLAIDGNSNVWVNVQKTQGQNGDGLTIITPSGTIPTNAPYSDTNVLGSTGPIAIDQSNVAWITNYTQNGISRYTTSTSGSNISIVGAGGPFTSGGLFNPSPIAIDAGNNIWAGNVGNQTNPGLSELTNTGTNISSSEYTGGGLGVPKGLAFDPSGNIWVAANSAIAEFNSSGAPLSGSSGFQPTSGSMSAQNLVVDANGHVWVVNGSSTRITEFTTAGAFVANISGNGISTSAGAMALDGGGNIWAGGLSNIVELNSSGTVLSPSNGYLASNLNLPSAMQVDSSGNLWVAIGNPAGSVSSAQNVTEFVGLAVPAITPLSAGLQGGQLGQRPGTPIPVVINASALPSYELSTSYLAQLHATGGNSGYYNWSISSGNLPSNITLSSAGTLSGTTAQGGSYTFTAKACDNANSTNCATQSFTLASTAFLPSRGNESALNGSYAVRFVGYRNASAISGSPSTSGAIYGQYFVGSVTFNGSGSITNGEVDVMSPNSTSVSTVTGVTGVYQLGTDNRGIMILTPSGSRPLEFAFSVGNFSGALAQTMQFVEFDDTDATTGGSGNYQGAGVGKLQTAAAFQSGSNPLNATFVFGLQGETACTNYNGGNTACPQTIAPFGPLSSAGYFTGSSGAITSGEEDSGAVGTNYNAVTLTGSYSNPDATFGRGTLTLNPSASFPGQPTSFIYYVVNSGEVFLMSSAGHLSSALLEGDALVQTPGVFSAAAPNPLGSSTLIAYGNFPTNGDGVSIFPTQDEAQLIMLAASGTSLTATSDSNNAASVSLNQSFGTLPYTVDAHGRMTFSVGAGNSAPIFYLASLSQGFGTEQANSSTDNPGLLVVNAQTGGPFSNSTISGAYSFASVPPPVLSSFTSGVITSAGAGSGSILDDLSMNTGVLTYGSTSTYTSTTATNGRATISASDGSTSVMYIISPTQFVLIKTSGTDTAPGVYFIQK